MPLKAIELLSDPLQSLSFIHICFLGFRVLGTAARCGMDTMIDFLFMHLLNSVVAGERETELYMHLGF